jgi:hypothetical protein
MTMRGATPGAAPLKRVSDRTVVRAKGLEPPRLASLEPKSSASTNSATPADAILQGPFT